MKIIIVNLEYAYHANKEHNLKVATILVSNVYKFKLNLWEVEMKNIAKILKIKKSKLLS